MQPPLSCHLWVFIVQCSPFPLYSLNWTRGELLLASKVRTEISWGLSSITSLAILSLSHCLLFYFHSQRGPQADTIFSALPPNSLSPSDWSHLHYRDMLENGGKTCLKYPRLSVASFGFPEEIKNSRTGGLPSCPRPCSYANVTVPTGHWHTWVLFKFTILQIEGWKREWSHEE